MELTVTPAREQQFLKHQFISSFPTQANALYTPFLATSLAPFQPQSERKSKSIYTPESKHSLSSSAHLSLELNSALGSSSLVESRANGTEPDVGEDDAGVGAVGLEVLRLAGGGRAGTARDSGLAWVGVGGVGGVEPQHVDRVVVPERHDEDVAAGERRAHGVEAAELREGVVVAEGGLLVLAEGVGDGVAGGAGDLGLGVLVHLAVLDVKALDLAERGAGADELGHNGHLRLGVELHAGAEEALVTHAVAVEVAAVLVADAVVAVVTVAAVSACAGSETRALAGMRGVGGRDGVGLPDVHLGAAGASVTLAGVGVVLSAVPALNVSLSVDPLDVVGALSVAVSWNLLETAMRSARVNLPVPNLAPALLLPLLMPPSEAISTK